MYHVWLKSVKINLTNWKYSEDGPQIYFRFKIKKIFQIKNTLSSSERCSIPYLFSTMSISPLLNAIYWLILLALLSLVPKTESYVFGVAVVTKYCIALMMSPKALSTH